jgi:enamine deaminase RidA (YjgF/YER057c/UK114 family)
VKPHAQDRNECRPTWQSARIPRASCWEVSYLPAARFRWILFTGLMVAGGIEEQASSADGMSGRVLEAAGSSLQQVVKTPAF